MKKVLLLLLISSIFYIVSCSDSHYCKSIDAFHENALKSLTQTFEIDIDDNNSNFSFTTEAGCRVRFPSSNFTLNGNLVSGKINIDIIEILTKGYGLNGMTTEADGDLLISGGEFFIRAYQGEDDLDFDDTYRIYAPIQLTGNYSDEMMLFERINTSENNDTWLLAQDSTTSLRVRLAEGSEDYRIDLEGFGWFNCDRFLNDPRPKIVLDIKVPAEFNDENSVVYFAIKNESSSLGDAIGFRMPRGLAIHLIFIADTDEGLLYQIMTTTASNNGEYVFHKIAMQQATNDELRDIINDLD